MTRQKNALSPFPLPLFRSRALAHTGEKMGDAAIDAEGILAALEAMVAHEYERYTLNPLSALQAWARASPNALDVVAEVLALAETYVVHGRPDLFRLRDIIVSLPSLTVPEARP